MRINGQLVERLEGRREMRGEEGGGEGGGGGRINNKSVGRREKCTLMHGNLQHDMQWRERQQH